MKQCFTCLLCLFLLASLAVAQPEFPSFLQGTWKVENEATFEHWDRLNDHVLKGFGYTMKDGQMSVNEYLEIVRKDRHTVYAAAVVGQNQGERIEFALQSVKDQYVFENLKHDFPKRIVYQKLDDATVQVTLSDGGNKSFGFKMMKQAEKQAVERDTSIANPNYDAALAQQYSGDDYGMKRFVLVILKTGTNTTTDKAFVNEAFRGHMNNIGRLVDEGKLIVAGPLGKNERTYRGIFILNNVANLDEAKTLLQTDPAIQSGLLNAEVFDWYGSAALPAYLKDSDKIWKVKP